jgi:hypothetical protein
MYRNSVLLMFALIVALFANMTGPMVTNAFAAGNNSGADAIEAQDNTSRVGLVVAYTVGQSITIMDRDGNQFTFALAADLKIVPSNRAGALAPGAYVTIIAPNNIPNGKQIAVGIVIHPGVPEGFPAASQTPIPTETTVTTATSVETPTSAETATPTEIIATTDTPTVTPAVVGTTTETPTPGATSLGTFTQDQIAAILDALSSFLRQVLSRS